MSTSSTTVRVSVGVVTPTTMSDIEFALAHVLGIDPSGRK